jgi:hypothetical protein
MSDLKLKRGCGLSFDGTNWNLAGDNKWKDCPALDRDGNQASYVPSGNEPFMGLKTIRGIPCAVFQCFNDDFIAQPVRICELPIPEDPMEILCTLEDLGKKSQEKQERKTATPVTMLGCLSFNGTNWRLAGDKKWRNMSGLVPRDLGKTLGEREIGRSVYDVYKGPAGFIAVRRDDEG